MQLLLQQGTHVVLEFLQLLLLTNADIALIVLKMLQETPFVFQHFRNQMVMSFKLLKRCHKFVHLDTLDLKMDKLHKLLLVKPLQKM